MTVAQNAWKDSKEKTKPRQQGGQEKKKGSHQSRTFEGSSKVERDAPLAMGASVSAIDQRQAAQAGYHDDNRNKRQLISLFKTHERKGARRSG